MNEAFVKTKKQKQKTIAETKVIRYIVTEEKGDAEHIKAISMPAVIINKASWNRRRRSRPALGWIFRRQIVVQLLRWRIVWRLLYLV